MRRRRRSRSLQSRVLALVGAGVFAAGALLAFLSSTSLRSLERELTHDHERLAASIARDLSRAVTNDMRLLARAAAAPPDDVRGALNQVRGFGRLASAAFVLDANGQVIACEPSFECTGLQRDVFPLAAAAAQTQRPSISNSVRQEDGRLRLAAVMPLRQVEGHPAAAGITIDPADRRLEELLVAHDIAPTLRVHLRDANGQPLSRAAPDIQPGAGFVTTVQVAGTPWILEVVDTGPDPRAEIIAFRRQSMWLAPTLAAVATLLGWGIARSVREPLVGLTKAAERIAAGDLEKPIEQASAAEGGDEVARLAAALEQMRQALVKSIGQIEYANEELEWRVADRTRQLAAVNARLEERERLRQKLLRQVISAQEEERKRVARELHDETSQTLAALGISVDLAVASCGPEADPRARARLADVRRLVGVMHQELHRMIMNLRPSVLDDLGLAAAIRWLAERDFASAGVAVRCEVGDLEERLPAEIETATFRIVQEALANVARHASAESVLVQGTIADGRVEVEIEDDGRGFDSTAIITGPDTLRGVGLLGMRERIEILGGTLTIDSTPGSGTRVAFSIPVPSLQAEIAAAGARS